MGRGKGGKRDKGEREINIGREEREVERQRRFIDETSIPPLGDENRGVSMPMPLRFLHFGSCRDKLFTRDAVIGMTGYHSITELPTRSFIA